MVVKAFGDTPMEAIEQQSALEVMEAPDAARLGAAEAIDAVRAAAVGWVDLLMTSGQYQHMARPPYVPGIEYAGVVVAKGAEVTAAVGDEVIVDPFLAGPRSLGAYQRWGGFAS